MISMVSFMIKGFDLSEIKVKKRQKCSTYNRFYVFVGFSGDHRKEGVHRDHKNIYLEFVSAEVN